MQIDSDKQNAMIILNSKAISDMAYIFDADTLRNSITVTSICYNNASKSIDITYNYLSKLKLIFRFIGDGYVNVYNKDMNILATYSCYLPRVRLDIKQLMMYMYDTYISNNQ